MSRDACHYTFGCCVGSTAMLWLSHLLELEYNTTIPKAPYYALLIIGLIGSLVFGLVSAGKSAKDES